MKPVYVIFVALKLNVFTHFYKEPKTFYDSYEEALEQLEHLIQTKQFNKSQLKIQKLWKSKTSNY